MAGALGLLSSRVGWDDVSRARAAAPVRGATFWLERVKSTSSGPMGQPFWQGAVGSATYDPCCCAGLPGSGTGRGTGIASLKIGQPHPPCSQRVAIQTMPLRRWWQPPCAPQAQSRRSCTRGPPRGARRARRNFMPPCRLRAVSPETAEPNR